MPSKGKQISVIIAGATGITGRNLVTRLVSHPDVSRVVALARHPIPVNRWTSVFPNLHSGDALRYLSVVPVDWVKVLADTANIPSSYVSDGVWRQHEEEHERLHFLNHMANRTRLGASGGGTKRSTDAAQRSGSGEHGSGAGPLSSVGTVESAVGIRPVGYVKFIPRGSFSARMESDERRREHGEGGGISLPHFTDTEKLLDSQTFLRQLLHNNFYTSVFSGHTVAINCLGTSHMLSTGSVLLVDYELSIAFAKMIRLFNCMAHADPTDDEERLMVEATSRELDSVLWGEIYSACYGKRAEAGGTSATPGAPLFEQGQSATARQGMEEEQMNRGRMATLKHFSQVSVRGANAASPIPYLHAHGLRDKHLLRLFNRHTETFASPSILHSLFLATPMTHTVDVAGGEQVATSASSPRSFPGTDPAGAAGSSVRVGPSPMRAKLEHMWRRRLRRQRAATGADGHHRSNSIVAQVRDTFLHLWRGSDHHHPGDRHKAKAERCHRYDRGYAAEPVEESPEVVARRRAQLLLRRDVVRIWENASLTIWRPGVFRRPKPRLSEWIFSFFERPVDVRILAECIVDDIIESVGKESDFGKMGSVKIINGKSVARRTTMKAIEDGLDERDTRTHKLK